MTASPTDDIRTMLADLTVLDARTRRDQRRILDAAQRRLDELDAESSAGDEERALLEHVIANSIALLTQPSLPSSGTPSP